VARGRLLPRLPAHPEDLDLLLLTAVTGRKVQRDGIRFASTRYVSPVLAAYVGETVTVRYDPRDAAELRVDHHEQYLCRAIAPELAADAVTLQQLQQARTARRRQLKQQLRDRRSLVDALPSDQRHLPAVPAPAPAEVATGLKQGSTAVPPVLPAPPAPAHRLRTYATD
jgi:putative transposase